MEHIREAIEFAKQGQIVSPQPPGFDSTAQPHPANVSPIGIEDVRLNAVHLEDNRIVAHDIADDRTKSIDMLRTQVLQSMNLNSWHFLGVTSPMPGCGKSVVSINLALSIARLSERSVLLVDLDFQKPQVAKYLGLKRDRGILGVLEGRTKLMAATKRVSIYNYQLFALPCEASTPRSSEFMSSRAIVSTMQEIKREFRSSTIIFDLPPILPSDEVLSILPSIDCVLMVAAAGNSTVPQIKECCKYLEATPVVRFVLNKASETVAPYYGYYGRNPE